MCLLQSFTILRPEFECSQGDALNWLARAHAQAEAKKRGGCDSGFNVSAFEAQIRKALDRYGCGPTHIARRGHVLREYGHADPAKWTVFGAGTPPAGVGVDARTVIFENVVDHAFEAFYQDIEVPPPYVIHVTCTGYVSPSGAQKLVSRRGWHRTTAVAHAYHMGCSAAVPALRLARGVLSAERMNQVDVVHTELCTLHLNPELHTPEQLVVQSLFADGMIRYSVSDSSHPIMGPGLSVLALLEEIVPDSIDAMAWRSADWGMRMVLSATIPERIAGHIGPFIERLYSQAGLKPESTSTLYAIHPGGPKILDFIEATLKLDPHTLRFSRSVLKDYGNMSSATLPHVWARILEDPSVPDGTPVVSLAFGPGLTICGALLRKRTC